MISKEADNDAFVVSSEIYSEVSSTRIKNKFSGSFIYKVLG